MSHRTTLLLAVAVFAAPAAVSAQGAFGSALAISGREVYVGQPGNSYAPGFVYVFRQDAKGVWRAAKKLSQADAKNSDGFGSALAIDGNTLLIGSAKADSESGVVFVFTRGATGWRESGRITAPDRKANDGFGSTILVAGDRAFIATGQQRRRGAVYAFRRNGDTWAAETTFAPIDTVANSSFGNALAASGNRLMIGNFRADSGTGAVYVYDRDPAGAWKMEMRIPPPGPITGKNSGFGSAILLRGDTAFIGASSDRGAGAVWIYSRDSTSGRWNPASRALPFDGSFGQRFGTAIAEVGHELWVGAPGSNQFQGAVYRLTRDSTGFRDVVKMGLPGATQQAGFGGRLAVAGGVAVIGLPNQDFGEGGAAIFSRAATGTWRMGGQVVGDVVSLEALTGTERECSGAKVGLFPCNQVDLLSFLPVSAIGGTRGIELNDIWGYTDPVTHKEYALVGRLDGTAFVDISNPSRPVYVGQLPKSAKAVPSIWRDIKTYGHYAFIVADGARDHGMQVFDLDRLRDASGRPVTFTEDARYDRVHSAHNIAVDTATGYAFIVGASGGGEMCGGGLHMVDIHDALHPTFAGCFADPQTGRQGTGYSHDAQCVVYRGPDSKYQGREICIGANETALSIADVTDKAHPVAISRGAYPNVAYAHQGWLTDDQKYFYQDDELDEMQGLVTGTRTNIWDVTDLSNPVLAGQYVSENHAIDHNLFIVGNTMYQSNYLSGLRVLDITDRLHPKPIGYFDTVPVGDDIPEFGGSWGNYPFFKSGIVAVTSMQEGLFILKKHPTPPVP